MGWGRESSRGSTDHPPPATEHKAQFGSCPHVHAAFGKSLPIFSQGRVCKDGNALRKRVAELLSLTYEEISQLVRKDERSVEGRGKNRNR